MTKYDKHHVQNVLQKAVGGDTEAIEELIKRQREGRAMRLYPNGREGPGDEGMCPIMMHVDNDQVIVKCGKPGSVLMFDREQAESWVLGMAESMSYVIGSYIHRGLDHPAIELAINVRATEDFVCEVEVLKEEDMVSVKFLPEGVEEWSLSVKDASNFCKKIIAAARRLGWKMKATDKQLKILKPFLLGENNEE